MFSGRMLVALALACSLGSLSAQQSITQFVVADADLGTLEELVIRAGLDGALGDTTTYTLFAPTEAAFTALPAGTLKSKLTSADARWTPLLADTLKYHVVPGNTSSSQLLGTATNVDTIAGVPARWKLSLKSTAPQVTPTNLMGSVDASLPAANVTSADNFVTNGVVHKVGAVLLPPSTQRSVVGFATGSAGLSTLVALLTAANLVTTLNTDAVATSYTVFAPDNAAFAKIASATVTCLQNNLNLLANVLKLHVVDGTVMAANLPTPSATATIDTIANAPANILTYRAANTLTSDSTPTSLITGTDNLASNGVVHVIDTVLLPKYFTCPATIVNTVAESTAHTTLLSLLESAGLVSVLQDAGSSGFTLFAPTDAAFAALGNPMLVQKLRSVPGNARWAPLLKDVLTYHVLARVTVASALPATATNTNTLAGKPGANWQVSLKAAAPQVTNVNGAGSGTVVAADLSQNNGVVHSIDGVLLPPSTQRDVVGIATGNTDFSTLVELLTAADLVSTLQTDSLDTSFTVFAPTNAAFAKLTAANITCLKQTANKALLANLLKLHVVGVGTVMSSALTVGQTITTLADGAANTITYSAANTLMASAAAGITDTDNLATNGVVHVIDTVLLPTGFTCTSQPDLPIPATTPTPDPDSAATTARASIVTLFLGFAAAAFALVF